jgi:adhesin transport system membrane fusion protein
MRGVVNKIGITTIGGVVRPGEEILQIIPLDEDLYIDAKVKPRDIASVRQGRWRRSSCRPMITRSGAR